MNPPAAHHLDDEPWPELSRLRPPQHVVWPPRRSPRARGASLVLIVEDTADTLELYDLYFRSRGFAVVTARDGEEGVDVAFRHQPDVIIMDLAMPRLDGVTATQLLKHDPRTRQTPIIILTGYSRSAIPPGALEAGADILLTKPCLPEELERRVRELHRPRGRVNDADGQAASERRTVDGS